MFDITTSEFLLIAVVILIAVGPKRAAEVSRQLGRWVGKLRTEATRFKHGIEQEINTVAGPAKEAGAEAKKAGEDLRETAQSAQADLAEGLRAVGDSVKELKGMMPSTRRRPLRKRWF
jgi:sec-independent protein translocase protein TatB